MRSIFPLLAAFCLFAAAAQAQEEYTFELSEIEKKAFEFGGYVEVRPVLLMLDRNSALYRLRLYGLEASETLTEQHLKALLNASYEKSIVRAVVQTNTDVVKSLAGWSHRTSLFQALVSVQPSLSFNLNVGKMRLRWGKGYAWNPVAFMDRPKNPNDPELALEGFVMASMDYVKSFPGKLKTIAITPAVLPVYENVNSTFGEPGRWNLGGKVYLLLYDTDIDLMFSAGGSRPNRYGFDVSRNIASNFELHGEFAYIPDFNKVIVDRDGELGQFTSPVTNYLVGMRYLTSFNTTSIVEFFHNGGGYRSSEMGEFYGHIDHVYESYLATGDDSPLKRLARAASPTYNTFAPMRDYLYIRISQKEPWNILYFIPAFTSIVNLNDKSYTLNPEALYRPTTNLELRGKVSVLLGGRGSEFGEKQNDVRLEFRGRYYF